MGILDEAIREHLELKRQHGADESELKGLENEAFGPADRPDATNPAGSAEAETQIISPGSSLTTPAGEGDQLDKVFEKTRQAEQARQEQEAAADAPPEAAAAPDATFAEHPIPDPPAPAPSAEQADTSSTEAATVESLEAKPAEPAAEAESEAPAKAQPPGGEGDAGDLLEAERQHLASHPTEHYDVDAAIAEEDEIDILSESSLSDELDRALDSGEADAAGGETVEYQAPVTPDSGEFETGEPASEELEADPVEPEADDSAEMLYEDAATENQPVEEGEEEAEEETEEGGTADFFDQEDPLEGTPDFLEETPEHDQLWFEQKEPKDFDFGD